MGSTPQTIHIRARFDGRVFVPDEPVELPTGTVLDGWTVPSLDEWAPGFVERTMVAWEGEDLEEPADPQTA